MATRRRAKKCLVIVLNILLIAAMCFAPGVKSARAGIADHVVVNEVHIDSIAGAGGHEDDWVELYNPTESDISLDGWSIQKTNIDGGSFYNQALSGTIPAGGYFLIVRNGSATEQSLKDMADVLADNSFLLASDFSIYLVNSMDDISSTTNPYLDPDIVDSVGYGNAQSYEGATAAPGIPDTKSISRSPDGEDSDENSIDFIVLDTPTPQNSAAGGSGDNLGGTVALTITPDANPVQNIGSIDSDIVFQVNTSGTAYVYYGLTSTYASTSNPIAFIPNSDTIINLSNLECDTTYHYAIYAENSGSTEDDQTADAVFTTLPCGIEINSLVMTKSSAKANDNYTDGWEWEFNITVWDMTETTLKMKFNVWTGAGSLDTANNMQFSVDGLDWIDITANDAYPVIGADISAIDESTNAGRQVNIFVRMKVPTGTLAGYYNSGYGILTE